MVEEILKKEDQLEYQRSYFNVKKGELVLTKTELYFVSKKGKEMFRMSLSEIVSVNTKRGLGAGVDHLDLIYRKNGNEEKAKIVHRSIMLGLAAGNWARMNAGHFASWEQAINDARFGKHVKDASGLDDLEKLAELKSRGVITDEEFAAKKKRLLGL